jgi:hypothetical protein
VVPHSDYDALHAALPDAHIVDLNVHYQSFRLVKSEAEMVFTRIGSRMNDAAVAALASALRPGLNDLRHPPHRRGDRSRSAWRQLDPFQPDHSDGRFPDRGPTPVPPGSPYRGRRCGRNGNQHHLWGYAGQILRTFDRGGTDRTGGFRLDLPTSGERISLVSGGRLWAPSNPHRFAQ